MQRRAVSLRPQQHFFDWLQMDALAAITSMEQVESTIVPPATSASSTIAAIQLRFILNQVIVVVASVLTLAIFRRRARRVQPAVVN
jgi:hypothetical protein